MQNQEAPQSKLLSATMEEMKELEPRAVMPNDGKTCFVERFVSEGRSESGSADEMSDQSALEESGLDEPDVDV